MSALRYGGTNVRTSALRWHKQSRAAVSRTSRLPHHEHLALRWYALSRCNIEDVRTSRTASRTFRATVARTSRATAARTFRATVVRTLALQYRGRPHLAYCITNIPRYGGTHSRAAISRTSAPWKHKCSCHRSADILSKIIKLASPQKYSYA